jgi:hypothetical protein
LAELTREPRRKVLDWMKANQAAFDIGQMVERLAHGYFMHVAAITAATDPRAEALSPEVEPGRIVPEGYAYRKDGTRHNFHFTYFLAKAVSDPAMRDDLDRLWLVGSLLATGDALTRHDYFDHAPELELLYRLRNGVAHGNVFKIQNPKRLAKFPAYNRLAWVRSDNDAKFEITPNLQNQPVLFDFMAAGDVLDLFSSVGLYLIRMGNGYPEQSRSSNTFELPIMAPLTAESLMMSYC